MLKLSYSDIVEKIKKETGLAEEEIDLKVSQKLKKFSDLISKEGAAHIVANELNVKVIDLNKRTFKINELVSGVRNAELLGKVVQKFDVREYTKNDRSGRVLSLILGDETGTMRVAVWDDHQIDFLEGTNEGDILKIKNGYIKENNGFKELHLNNKSTIFINPEGHKVGEVLTRNNSRKKLIKDLGENDYASISGTVVQVFEPRFYEACPECNKKVSLENGKHSCVEHGNVIEKIVPILNLFLDDGTDNIRVVAFREVVARILGIKDEELQALREKNFDDFKNDLLGKQLMITGRAVKNTMFDRLELMANSVEELNALDIANELIKEVK